MLIPKSIAEIPKVSSDCSSSYHLYVLQLDTKNQNNQNQIFEKLRSAGFL